MLIFFSFLENDKKQFKIKKKILLLPLEKEKRTNNNGPKSYLQTPTFEKAKQKIRPKPGRPIRSNPKQQLATTKRYR